jgi:hypothetical protein
MARQSSKEFRDCLDKLRFEILKCRGKRNMKSDAVAQRARHLNFVPLSDPIRKEEVKISLTLSADERAIRSIERQVGSMNPSPDEVIASCLACHEDYTFVDRTGRLVCGEDVPIDLFSSP